jgi:linoleoyl-CoA desaturase
MTQLSFTPIKFTSTEKKDFSKTLNKRVNNYFKSKNLPKTGDYRIWIKVIAMPLLYFLPFFILLSNLFFENIFAFYGLWILMGIGMSGCGLGIMHDACHGAISKNKSINNLIGFVINLAGGYALNWKIQHNILHHSYTNIANYDEDIDTSGIMRFSPNQPLKFFYKYQIVYAWFFYGLMTFFWATFKDFNQLIRYNKKGLLKTQKASFKKELTKLILLKIIYYLIFIIMPILLVNISWVYIITGWFIMHFTSGLILACIFQSAHVVPSSKYPKPDENNEINNDFAVHQLLTTANFAPNNKILTWYIGGLNYQIEHHLFPSISHVHHKELSKIVSSTASEFGLPYNSQPTFMIALKNHAKMLLSLSK